ncbi:MAG: sucrase ferredoxin, partial [Leptolyngbyaceae bacterium]|nr:sucrase ferredoxin [Leptolyngbyaceae bacterium]
MPAPFFCAEEAQQLQEDPIGCAGTFPLYILVECPTPWPAQALKAAAIPDNLRTWFETYEDDNLPIRLLLIANEQSHRNAQKRVLMFRQQTGFSAGYTQQEFVVDDLEQVVPLIQTYLTDPSSLVSLADPSIQDFLICTHGSHDKCCAKYGLTFYKQAIATLHQSSVSPKQVRLWQVSH